MHRFFISLVLLCASFSFAPQLTSAVTIAWSPVGNSGNAADTTVMNDGTTGYGAVHYAYNIGTYDVTASQYVEFLNAKDSSGANTLGLYNTNMSQPAIAGISFNASNANGTKYGVISERGNHPANYITWYNAIRFANWLNNGQGNGDTETGAYTLLGGTPTPSNGNSITRNAGATIFLPNENEWHKAAYYNPGTSSYFKYPTSSDTTPTPSSPTTTPNSANYSNLPDRLTDVGAYSGTTSPYGAFDLGGNVWQWNENLFNGPFRGMRGGGFSSPSVNLLSSNRGNSFLPSGESSTDIGFRLASVSEPSSMALAAMAGLFGLTTAARRKRHRVASH